jgi:hypothetical protein
LGNFSSLYQPNYVKFYETTSPAFLGSLSFFWKENNMKKLLSLLGAVGLIATSSATVVSCGDPDKGTSNNDDNNGGNDDDKYPDHATYTMDEFFSLYGEKNDDGVYEITDEVKTSSRGFGGIWQYDVQNLSIGLIIGLTRTEYNQREATFSDLCTKVFPTDSSLKQLPNEDNPDKPKSEVVSGEKYSLTYKMDSDFVDEDTNATITKTDSITVEATFVLVD